MKADHKTNVCVSCQNAGAINMCQDCGAVLCPDCLRTKTTQYLVCGDCHGHLGPDAKSSDPKCPSCGSKNIRSGRRTEQVCPRCLSTRVISIEERRRKLAGDLRHAIMLIQHGHVKFREFANRLMLAKRLLYSIRMANFLAFNWLEDKLEGLLDGVPLIKNRIVSQADIVARRIAAETNGFMNQETWDIEQFPFIEGLTRRITEIGNQYRQTVDETVEPSLRELEELIKHLEGLDYHRREFAGFYQHSELAVNELPICAIPEVRLIGSDFLRADHGTGELYVTNKRMVFIAETGRLRKTTGVVFDFPLMYLNSIEEDGRIRRHLVLKMKQGDVKIACSEHTQKVLTDYIEIAKRFDRYVQTDLQRVRRLEQVDVAASDVKLKIDDLVYTLLSSRRTSLAPHDRSRLNERELTGDRTNGRWFPPWDYEARRRMPISSGLPSLDRMEPRTYDTYGYRRAEDDLLRRFREEADQLDRAISRSIEDLRLGRLMTDDFVSRYRSLMRERYTMRRRMDEYLRQYTF
ncbi:MAG: hypothetical protein QXS20_06605 [Candidatus Thorarchaeota archaeon]